MGTAEVESALVLHEDIAEAAVVGFPHDIKGQGIYAYVTPMTGVEDSESLRKELIALCVVRSAPSPSRIGFSGHRDCPRPDLARSCANFA